jgi:6,7-dimethyl-8-ribityllumazine synthase
MHITGDYTQHNIQEWKVGIVVSRFNELITKSLAETAILTLSKAGLNTHHIDLLWVPGAHEIPLILQSLAKQKKYQGLIALGCVIKGDTAHFDVVVDAVNKGTLRVSLDHHLPITTGVLTTTNLQQALDRSESNSVHNKGHEAALALLELIALKNSLEA